MRVHPDCELERMHSKDVRVHQNQLLGHKIVYKKFSI